MVATEQKCKCGHKCLQHFDFKGRCAKCMCSDFEGEGTPTKVRQGPVAVTPLRFESIGLPAKPRSKKAVFDGLDALLSGSISNEAERLANKKRRKS